jgi:hypothetical protein
MSWGIGSFMATKDAVARKLPIPQSFHTGPLNITCRMASFEAGTIGIVMLIGASIRQAERYPVKITVPRY